MNNKKIIAPSILAADFGNLQSQIEIVNQSNAEWLHIDIMDGNFVPNISFGFPVLDAIKKHCTKKLDIHLMIAEPEKYIDRFCAYEPEVITFHYEASNHLHRTIYQIKEKDVKAGVALNPHTRVEVLEDILLDLDLVCLMSVNPGFGGQSFINKTFHKIHRLNKLKLANEASLLIEVDGGVDSENIDQLSHFGTNVFVAGSSVFKSEDINEAISALNNKVNTIT